MRGDESEGAGVGGVGVRREEGGDESERGWGGVAITPVSRVNVSTLVDGSTGSDVSLL